MKFPVSLTSALFFSALFFHQAHASTDAPALKIDQILKELDQLELKRKAALRSSKAQALSKLQAASQSGPAAVNLYTDAVEKIQFDGRLQKGQTFQEWEEKNAVLLSSREMESAAALQVRYLILSIQRGEAEKGDALVNPSLAYLRDLEKFLLEQSKKGPLPQDAKKLLDSSINDSLIAKAMFLAPLLPKTNWENNPGNFSGIMEKNIRPHLIESKNPYLIQTWDMQLKFEEERIANGRVDNEIETFKMSTAPTLRFARANARFQIGQSNIAANEILSLIRSNPAHPDFDKWTARLREILSKPNENEPAQAEQKS
jgi:predicted Zn-dependent protease